MKAKRAKQLADEHGFQLWYDRHMQMWVVERKDLQIPADWIPSSSLEGISEQRFIDLWLTPSADDDDDDIEPNPSTLLETENVDHKKKFTDEPEPHT